MKLDTSSSIKLESPQTIKLNPNSTTNIGVASFSTTQYKECTISIPKYSKWVCYLFGNTPETNTGITYRPLEVNEPNLFRRLMMKLFFDCTWVKED